MQNSICNPAIRIVPSNVKMMSRYVFGIWIFILKLQIEVFSGLVYIDVMNSLQVIWQMSLQHLQEIPFHHWSVCCWNGSKFSCWCLSQFSVWTAIFQWFGIAELEWSFTRINGEARTWQKGFLFSFQYLFQRMEALILFKCHNF